MKFIPLFLALIWAGCDLSTNHNFFTVQNSSTINVFLQEVRNEVLVEVSPERINFFHNGGSFHITREGLAKHINIDMPFTVVFINNNSTRITLDRVIVLSNGNEEIFNNVSSTTIIFP